MTDLEMTRLCAEAMGIACSWTDTKVYLGTGAWNLETSICYQPLHDDAQAMALDQVILNAGYCISMDAHECEIYPVADDARHKPVYHWNAQMTPEMRRRVRVECVAKMQKAKQ